MLSNPQARAVLRADLTASLVVFLVALPLCVGVAVASGVPAELGLITGIVGGLVAGLLPGSSLQVSGPAAGSDRARLSRPCRRTDSACSVCSCWPPGCCNW